MKKITALFAALILLTSCGSKIEEDVEVYRFSQQNISRSCILGGTVDYASVPEAVKSKMIGTAVDKVYVNIGDYVEAGAVLCSFDTSSISREAEDLRNSIMSSEEKLRLETEKCREEVEYEKKSMEKELDYINSNIETQRAKIETLKERAAQAQDNYSDSASLADELRKQMESAEDPELIEAYSQQLLNASSRADSLLAEAQSLSDQLTSAESSLRTMEYNYEKTKSDGELAVSRAENELAAVGAGNDLAASKLRLSRLESQLECENVTAPASGYISTLNVSDGTVLVDELVAEICSSDKLHVEITVPDEYILSLKEGQNVTFSSSSMNNVEYSGVISKVSDFRTDEGFKAVISTNMSENLIVGMSVSAMISLDEQTVPAIPRSAVHKDQDGNSYFMTAEPVDGGSYIVKNVYFTQGISNSEYVEVCKCSVKNDTFVITSKNNYFEGETVKIVEEENGDDAA